MDMADILQKELCAPLLKSRHKRTILQEIAALMKKLDCFASIEEAAILKALEDREAMGSTGFGDGVAIPHCRIAGLKQFVLGIGISKRGIDFDALDNRKVHLFCYLLGPEAQPNMHVKILAAISQVVGKESAREELLKAPTALALYESYLRHAYFEEGPSQAQDLKLLMLVLQNEEHVNDVMELFIEMGIRGASVIESDGMAKILSTVPLFASFINFLGGKESYHRTIFSVVPAKQLSRLVTAVEAITGDMDTHTGAMALAMDIAMIKGSLQTI